MIALIRRSVEAVLVAQEKRAIASYQQRMYRHSAWAGGHGAPRQAAVGAQVQTAIRAGIDAVRLSSASRDGRQKAPAAEARSPKLPRSGGRVAPIEVPVTRAGEEHARRRAIIALRPYRRAVLTHRKARQQPGGRAGRG